MKNPGLKLGWNIAGVHSVQERYCLLLCFGFSPVKANVFFSLILMNSAYVALCLTPVFTALLDSTYSIQECTWSLHLCASLFCLL